MHFGISPHMAVWVKSLSSALGESVVPLDSSAIPPLQESTKNRVVLVDASFLDHPSWPALRTRLLQAGRRYLVAAKKMEIMEVVRAMRDGAHDCVETGDSKALTRAVAQAAAAQAIWLEVYHHPHTGFENLIGSSLPFRRLLDAIQSAGPTEASVMILGETGTGKEEVARALHASRPSGPFIAVNCAAIPRDLIESELFGVAAGAFTGARHDRPGLVEQATGGTLFLDEITELSLDLQPKLLRFLELRTARRVGSRAEYHIDTRVVAATNRPPTAEGTTSGLRTDLYYRLAEVVLAVPPLRDRISDLPALAAHFLHRSSERFGKHFDEIDPALIRSLASHNWPGNVRELRLAIDRMVLAQPGPVLRPIGWDPPPGELAAISHPDLSPPSSLPASSARLPRRQREAHARRLLEDSGGDLGWTASTLGIHPTTLYRWRKKWEQN
jgi:DNA-binding NtrC family response regulator